MKLSKNLLISFLSLIFLFITSLTAFASTYWEKIYGDEDYDLGRKIIKTSDGNFIAIGIANDNNENENSGTWFIKIDINGNEIWSKQIISEDTLIYVNYDIDETPDGGYLLTGWSGLDYGICDGYLIKTDSQGRIEWSKTYGNPYYQDHFQDTQIGEDGNFNIVGYTEPESGNNREIWLLKTDSTGNEIWSKTYGTNFCNEQGSSLYLCKNDKFIIQGSGNCFPGPGIWLLSTNADGIRNWFKTILDYDNGIVYPHYIEQTKDNDFLLIGECFSGKPADLWFMKLDNDGFKQWIATREYNPRMDVIDICPLENGGYILAGGIGLVNNDSYIREALIMEVDNNFNRNWYWIHGDGTDKWDCFNSVLPLGKIILL